MNNRQVTPKIIKKKLAYVQESSLAAAKPDIRDKQLLEHISTYTKKRQKLCARQ